MNKHPNLNLIDVRCTSCGNTFLTRSSADAIVVDVCSNCHPAYTGIERKAATGSRLERFNKKRALART